MVRLYRGRFETFSVNQVGDIRSTFRKTFGRPMTTSAPRSGTHLDVSEPRTLAKQLDGPSLTPLWLLLFRHRLLRLLPGRPRRAPQRIIVTRREGVQA